MTLDQRLVVLDMDSTFIQQEVIDLLASHAGVGEAVAAITERSMRGELDFKASLRERVALLKGLPEEIFEVVRGEEDGDAISRETAQVVPHTPAKLDIDTRRRLIQNKELRVVDKRTSNHQPPLHPARKRP